MSSVRKILMFVIVSFGVIMEVFAQYQPHLPDLRDCQTFNCPANNFSIQSVYLSDINGVPISQSRPSCNAGEIIEAYLSIKYFSNAGSPVYNGRILADLIIGDQSIFINYFIGLLNPSSGMTITLVDEVLHIRWECGDMVSLENPHTIYTASTSGDHSTEYTCANNKYTKSQCGNSPTVSVDTPHILDFSFVQACTNEDGQTAVTFENHSRGGMESYQYLWDFGVSGHSSLPDPTVIYTGSGTATLNLVGEGGEVVSSFTQTVALRDTDVIDLLRTEITNQSDRDNPNGSITPYMTREGDFMFLWSGPDDFFSDKPSISGLTDGIYTVTIADEYGCLFVYVFELPAYVTLPLDISFESLSYNPKEASVLLEWSLPQKEEEYPVLIERSIDGVMGFEAIATLAPDRLEFFGGNYRFVDRDLPPSGGRLYYRLVITGDPDFHEPSYSTTRMVNVPPQVAKASWKVYPNPTMGNRLILSPEGRFDKEIREVTVHVSEPSTGRKWTIVRPIGSVDLSGFLKEISGRIFFVQVAYGSYQETFKVLN